MRRALLALAGLCWPMLAACDVVGAPLVDRVAASMPPPPLTLPCTAPLECAAPEPGPDAHPRVDVRPIDLVVCGMARSRTCTLRDTADAAEVATVDADADADAGVEPGVPVTSCTPQLGLDDAGAQCETLELIAEGGDHVVTGLTLRSVNLSVRASRPTTLTLEDATLEAVFVLLEGPITLRLEAARSVDTLRAVTSASGDGQPRLELLDVDATHLQAGTVETPFGGALLFDQVELEDAQLLAEHMELQSFALEGGRIEAQELSATDAQFSNAILALDDAVLSAFTLTATTFERCHTLALIAGKLYASTLIPCAGPPVRVYATEVIASRADGRFESDGSLWERVAFGASADTELVAFGGQLRSVNFCDAAGSPKLGDGLSVSCSKCDGWGPSSTPPCRLSDHELSFSPNYCPLLDVRTFAVCPEPTPERDRPLEQPF